MVHYSFCPVCLSKDIAVDFHAKDNTVSTDTFYVWKCIDCKTKFTQDVADEKEIGKYYQSENYISHSDTQKGLVNLLYHKVRQFTLVGKRKLVCHETRKSKGNLLDIGCGTGAFINIMKQSSWSVTGLEPDSTAAEKVVSFVATAIFPVVNAINEFLVIVLFTAEIESDVLIVVV